MLAVACLGLNLLGLAAYQCNLCDKTDTSGVSCVENQAAIQDMHKCRFLSYIPGIFIWSHDRCDCLTYLSGDAYRHFAEDGVE